MTVAITAGALPSPKNIKATIRKIKLGILCITLRTGLRIASTNLTRAIIMPIGMPNNSEIITAAMTTAIVIMVSSQ